MTIIEQAEAMIEHFDYLAKEYPDAMQQADLYNWFHDMKSELNSVIDREEQCLMEIPRPRYVYIGSKQDIFGGK